MLSFAVSGTIGCILTHAGDEMTLAISSVLVRADRAPRAAWVLCIVRDASLRGEIVQHFRAGDTVRIVGEIEQRRREIGAIAFHSVVFVARAIERTREP